MTPSRRRSTDTVIMGIKNESASLSLPHISINLKILLVVVAVIFQKTCLCANAEIYEPSSKLTREVTETVGNQFDSSSKGTLSRPPNQFENEDDIIELKRHLGALAALSGTRQFTGSKSFIPPSKKHLGSIAAAAQSSGRLGGKKLENLIPSFQRDMYKRHLGAVMAMSGVKSRPLTRSLKESLSEYEMNSPADYLELETPPMNRNMDSQYGKRSYAGSGAAFDVIPEEIQSSNLDLFRLYEDEPTLLPSSEHEFTHLNVDSTDTDDDANDQSISYKSKRFLGTLARGGWFPRHFRGVISENTFGKRHIGALARLGWMPHAKSNGRLSLAMEDQRGDIGLKRNDLATRRRMLYHFTAPSLWTSPRGK